MTYYIQYRSRRAEFWRGWTYGAAAGMLGAPLLVLALFRLL